MDKSYAAQYAELWRRHWWWRVRQQLVLKQMAETLADDNTHNRKIFDIGCAGGLAFDDWAKFGEPYGIEPDPELIGAAPSWRGRVEHGPFGADYVASQQYDLALMLDVLEHIEDDAGALAAVRRLLKPGGHLILTVPALQSLWSHHDVVNQHFRRYDRRSLRSVLAGQSFEVVKLRYVFGWSLGLMYVRKLLLNRPRDNYVVSVPSRPVNATFLRLSQFEELFVSATRCGPPWGSSLLAVARRVDD